jgi:hypothetical protein
MDKSIVLTRLSIIGVWITGRASTHTIIAIMYTPVSIVIDTISYPVLLGKDHSLVLLKSISSLLGVQLQSLSKRLERAGLGLLTQYASKEAAAAFKAFGAISSKEHATRVFTLEALCRLPASIDPVKMAKVATLISDAEELGRETESTNFLEHASKAPESPKDKASRIAVMPSLKESVALRAR